MEYKYIKDIQLSPKIHKQLQKMKVKNKTLYVKVMASINSLKTHGFDNNYLVTKKLDKNLYELKVDSENKYIRVFYSETIKKIMCWELLEKKSNKIPNNLIRELRKKVK